MAMNDEETVALIAGGHSLAKRMVPLMQTNTSVPNPREPLSRSKDSVGRNTFGSGKGVHTITSGLEGAWTTAPTTWDNNFFENLFNYDWELIKGPGGAWQWTPKDESAQGTVPDAHDSSKKHAPMMLTTDLSLKADPVYEKISQTFLREPGGIRRCLCEGVVQTDAPRYGTPHTVSRSLSS